MPLLQFTIILLHLSIQKNKQRHDQKVMPLPKSYNRLFDLCHWPSALLFRISVVDLQ